MCVCVRVVHSTGVDGVVPAPEVGRNTTHRIQGHQLQWSTTSITGCDSTDTDRQLSMWH